VGKLLLLWCGLPNVQGVINWIHIDILKLEGAYVEDYYYHQTKGYNIITQVVINCNKFYINIFVGLPRNVKDSMVLHTFALYR
jgi:hypothetical protein